MKTARVLMKSKSPYSQSRPHNAPKLEKEGADDYRERTWRNHAHFGPNGNIIIPPMSFKNALSEAAKFISMQIPGKNKQTYTKHFEAGVMVSPEPIELPITKETLEGETLFLPSDGRRGGGKRVWKTYPVIYQWEGIQDFFILDETITKDVFLYHIEQAGKFIGIGRFRPRNNGFYGRFEVVELEWLDN